MTKLTKKEINRKMYKEMVKIFFRSIVECLLFTLLILLVGSLFNIRLIEKPTASIYMGIAGVLLAFIGNAMVSDSVRRYDAGGLPQWKWGNKIQASGFALTVIALLVK